MREPSLLATEFSCARAENPKPTLWIKFRWTLVIIVAAFLRIASETVAPYFAKAYLVLFVQMWAPLLVALSGRVIFRVTLPYGFVPASIAMTLSAGVGWDGAGMESSACYGGRGR